MILILNQKIEPIAFITSENSNFVLQVLQDTYREEVQKFEKHITSLNKLHLRGEIVSPEGNKFFEELVEKTDPRHEDALVYELKLKDMFGIRMNNAFIPVLDILMRVPETLEERKKMLYFLARLEDQEKINLIVKEALK